MYISVLMDNVAGDGLASEWGFSCAVEGSGGMLLWDCGQTAAFLDNARELGVNVSELEALAISHGHYDHAGGLKALLDAGFTGAIHGHSAIRVERFSVSGDSPEAIGVPFNLPAYETVRGSKELIPGITMVTDIPRLPGNHEAVDGFALDREGTRPDPVPDDAFLLLETAPGPVVLLGCCHAGLANSLAVLKERHGLDSIHAVVGGLHLYNANEDKLDQAVQALRDFGVGLVVPGHCTGEKATAELMNRLEAVVRPMHSGMRLCF